MGTWELTGSHSASSKRSYPHAAANPDLTVDMRGGLHAQGRPNSPPPGLDHLRALVPSRRQAEDGSVACCLTRSSAALGFLDSAAATASAVDNLAASSLREAVGELRSLGTLTLLPADRASIHPRTRRRTDHRCQSGSTGPSARFLDPTVRLRRPARGLRPRPRRGPRLSVGGRGPCAARCRARGDLRYAAAIHRPHRRGGVVRPLETCCLWF